jgi:hypothetical protein
MMFDGWGVMVGLAAFCGVGALFIAANGGGTWWYAGGGVAVAPLVVGLAITAWRGE